MVILYLFQCKIGYFFSSKGKTTKSLNVKLKTELDFCDCFEIIILPKTGVFFWGHSEGNLSEPDKYNVVSQYLLLGSELYS